MRTFALFTKNNPSEIINKVEADDIVDAISLFSEIKKLDSKSLTSIFSVSEIKK
jgi:hypothetical protein